MMGALLSLLNQTLLNPMLPSIMADTHVDATTAQWLASGFTLVNAIVIAITAFLMDRFTTRKLFISSFVLFLIGSILGAWGPNFGVLLAGRLLQAICGGVMIPMTMTILLLFYPAKKRGSAMGMFSLVIMVAPAIGPALSGVVTDSLGWHMLFALMAVLAVVILVTAIAFLQNAGETKPVTLDKPSLLFCSFGLLFLLYGFSQLGHVETVALGVVLVVVGAVTLFFFTRRQLHMEQPFLEIGVLKNKRFLLGTIVLMILQASLASLALTLPLYIQTVRGMSATTSGLVMIPGAIFGAIAGYFSGRLYDKFGPYKVTIVGIVLLGVGSLMCVFFDMTTPVLFISASFAVRNVGLMLANTPLTTWSISKLSDKVLHHGNAVSNTLRQVAATLFIAIMISIMSLVTSVSEKHGNPQAELFGITATFIVSLGIVVVALVVVIVSMRGSRNQGSAKEVESAALDLNAAMKSNPYTINATDTLDNAIRSFLQYQTSGLPIIEDDGRIVGFISDGDVMRFMEKHNVSLAAENLAMVMPDTEGFDAKASSLMKQSVMDIGTRRVITAPHDASLQDVCEIFATRRMHKLPVSDHGILVGTISRGDVMRVLMQRLDQHFLK
jgi:EmrB/QacA subfamily drug resistance transporter